MNSLFAWVSAHTLSDWATVGTFVTATIALVFSYLGYRSFRADTLTPRPALSMRAMTNFKTDHMRQVNLQTVTCIFTNDGNRSLAILEHGFLVSKVGDRVGREERAHLAEVVRKRLLKTPYGSSEWAYGSYALELVSLSDHDTRSSEPFVMEKSSVKVIRYLPKGEDFSPQFPRILLFPYFIYNTLDGNLRIAIGAEQNPRVSQNQQHPLIKASFRDNARDDGEVLNAELTRHFRYSL